MTIVKDYRHYGKEQSKVQGEKCTVVNVKENVNVEESEVDDEQNKGTNWRQFFIICSVFISAYLINGEHAQGVCNICTTVPAAIFTYKQLSDRTTRIFAYKATLFYWSIHGILVAFDSIFLDAFGYFFGKFILLVVLFFNVVYQHDVAKKLIEQQNQHHSAVTGSITNSETPVHYQGSPYGSQVGLNTAMTITDATQFSILTPLRIRQPTQHSNSLSTAFSLARSPEMTAYLDTTYSHDGSLKTVASAEEEYKFGTYGRRRTAIGQSSMMSDSGDESEKTGNDVTKPIPAGDCQKVGDEAGGSLRSSDYITSTMINKENEETLITDPPEYIVFKYPFTDKITIYVTNKHSRPIMWALKTNAIKRMVGQPTCGILGKNATVHIKVGVNAAPPEESNMNDRIAIDYCLIDDDTVSFDRSFLYNSDDPFRRRKKLNVFYEN